MTVEKNLIASAASPLVVVALISPGLAFADAPYSFSANIGVVSNYLWRGTSQTDDGPAIQGGLDFAHESGFSAGTWASNVDFADIGDDSVNPPIVYEGANYELDLYMGYDFTLPVEDASLGLNTIYYAYPDADLDIDFWEIGISGGYKFFSAGIQYTVWGGDDNEDAPFDEGDFYYYASLDFALPYEFGLGLKTGYYDFDSDDENTGATESADYWHWGVSISREAGDFGTFSFNYEQNDGDEGIWDDDPKIWIGWNKEF